jgi:Rps23 Pro-64 3,4-dihydroxylase Tpa1-like proline 4-hydroxylase
MTPKQILDSFSETLMRDDRILSAPERTLVATLLQHAKAATVANPETQEAVRAVIASAVGETVAQRAFAVLGGSIVDRILESSALQNGDAGVRPPDIYASPKTPGEPQPPGTPVPPPREPQPPTVSSGVRVARTPIVNSPLVPPPKEPQPPGAPLRDTPVVPPPKEPQPPGTPLRPLEPQPPTATSTTIISQTSAAVADRPTHLTARCVVLDEFLAPQELEELTRFTLEHEAAFSTSEVISHSSNGGVVNYEHRRSRVLMDLAQYQDVILERIRAALPQVLGRLEMEPFSIADVEAQVTASNDGDFFHFHSDNGSERVASRHLTFVYFFHREPCQFQGGELRIHDAHLEDGTYVSDGSYQTIVPRQNQIVFFPCELLHEITPVNCSTQLFADSRFTLNGWLRR